MVFSKLNKQSQNTYRYYSVFICYGNKLTGRMNELKGQIIFCTRVSCEK